MPKRKSVYEEKYKKGTRFTFKSDLTDRIVEVPAEDLYLMAHGKNEDGTEYMVVRIDGIPPLTQ